MLKDIEETDEQDAIINDYHIKSNHRGIIETLSQLNRTVFCDNLKSKITNNKTINNREICQMNKYGRNPIKQKFAITETPYITRYLPH